MRTDDETQFIPRAELSPHIQTMGDLVGALVHSTRGRRLGAILCAYLTPDGCHNFWVRSPETVEEFFGSGPWLARDILEDAGSRAVMGYAMVYTVLNGLSVHGFGADPLGRLWHEGLFLGMPLSAPGEVAGEFFTANSKEIWGSAWEPVRP